MDLRNSTEAWTYAARFGTSGALSRYGWMTGDIGAGSFHATRPDRPCGRIDIEVSQANLPMPTKITPKEAAGWVELPTGIFTADGIWFHTTEAALREFAGPVVEDVGLGPLLMSAGTWYRSADTAAAISLAVLLLLVPASLALLLTVVLYLFWSRQASTFVFIPLVRLFTTLSKAGFQGVLYVVVVSWLGMGGDYVGVAIGLAGFILLRWGLARRALARGSGAEPPSGTELPRQDRILRNLVLRHAFRLRITLPSTAAYENRIIEIWQSTKRKV